MRKTWILLFAAALSCSRTPDSDPDLGASDASPDMTRDTGAPDEGGSDVSTPDDATHEPDTAVAPCAPAPVAVIAGTTETDALADAAARCGQAPYAWLRSAVLGDVTTWGDPRELTTTLLGALAEQGGIGLPRPPERDVTIRPFAYMTQDRGALLEATALLAVPRGFEEGESRDVILLLHGYTGSNDRCAPSDSIQWQAIAALFASYGYLVVMPDYIGMKSLGEPSMDLHPALVGQATAIAGLDAVRAVQKMSAADRGGLCATTRVAMWGASQGGGAALWVDRFAPYYARELTLVGGVTSVPFSDYTGQATLTLTMPDNAFLTLLAQTLPGVAAWYDADLATALSPPYDVSIAEAAATTCSLSEALAGTTAEDLFTASVRDAATAGTLDLLDPWGCIFAENSVATTSAPRLPTGPGYGLLYVVGGADELLDPSVQRAAFEALCAQGMPLDYLECAGGDHFGTNLDSAPRAIEFLEARLAGEPAPASCALTAPVTCAM